MTAARGRRWQVLAGSDVDAGDRCFPHGVRRGWCRFLPCRSGPRYMSSLGSSSGLALATRVSALTTIADDLAGRMLAHLCQATAADTGPGERAARLQTWLYHPWPRRVPPSHPPLPVAPLRLPGQACEYVTPVRRLGADQP